MFVSNPDSFLLPAYRISPFLTSSISRNLGIPEQYISFSQNYFDDRFGKGNWMLTSNGREAIELAVGLLNRPMDTSMTILTTSGNTYISGCVTASLEKTSTWNRSKSAETDTYFVNHEFGYIYPNMESLVGEGLPIIEDCCTTFFSQDDNHRVGKYGNYSIYSFPKFFSIQIGGLLVGEGVGENKELSKMCVLNDAEKAYILKVTGFELEQVDKLLGQRKAIFDYAADRFSDLGFSLWFPKKAKEVPSLLLLKNNGRISDLAGNKEWLYAHGIQNSVFYGEDAFFLPCHQNLSEVDIDYFLFVIHQFIQQN